MVYLALSKVTNGAVTVPVESGLEYVYWKDKNVLKVYKTYVYRVYREKIFPGTTLLPA